MEESGYERVVTSLKECEDIKKFSRVWKKILPLCRFNEGASPLKVFEFGCGGGNQLMQFALNGWQCVGLDISPEVIDRAKNFKQSIERICGKSLDAELVSQNFFDYENKQNMGFDLVFHVGVLEHFLDPKERMLALKKMFSLVAPGGYIVSIVPSGTHPLRQKMKQLKLGGYHIPEIDYVPELMQGELRGIGGADARVLPHNIFGYFSIDPSTGPLMRLVHKIIFYFFQVMPFGWLPKGFAYRHSATLIGLARKEANT